MNGRSRKTKSSPGNHFLLRLYNIPTNIINAPAKYVTVLMLQQLSPEEGFAN